MAVVTKVMAADPDRVFEALANGWRNDEAMTRLASLVDERGTV